MIAPITRGKNIYGLVNYHERKVEQGRARLLYQQGFMARDSALYKAILQSRIQQSRIVDSTFHVSLNLPHSEAVSEETWEKIAREYMLGMGYGAQPYLVYEHADRDHRHIHIISVRVDEGGKKISDFYEWRRSGEVCQALEKKYGLWQVEHKLGSKAHQKADQKVDLKFQGSLGEGSEEEQKMGVRARIAKGINQIKDRYKPSSFAEYKKLLILEGVTVVRAGEGAINPNGLIYGLRDLPEARKVAASSIYHSATLKALEGRFLRNRKKKEEYSKSFLVGKIEGALAEKSFSGITSYPSYDQGKMEGKSLQKGNKSRGIGGWGKPEEVGRIGKLGELPDQGRHEKSERGFALRMAERRVTVLYEKNRGGTYGISFLDEGSGYLYKGSELGPGLSYESLKGRIGLENGDSYLEKGRGGVALVEEKHSRFYQSVQEGIWKAASCAIKDYLVREEGRSSLISKFLASPEGEAFERYVRIPYGEKMAGLERVVVQAIAYHQILNSLRERILQGPSKEPFPKFSDGISKNGKEDKEASLFVLRREFWKEYKALIEELKLQAKQKREGDNKEQKQKEDWLRAFEVASFMKNLFSEESSKAALNDKKNKQKKAQRKI